MPRTSEAMPSPLHPLFCDRPEDTAKLWRYLSFAKLAALFQSSQLHFTRVDKLDDHFEGVWPKIDFEYFDKLSGFDIPTFTKQMHTAAAVSCWIEMPHESAAMWRLYAPGKEGIAITTTFGKLSAVVEEANALESIYVNGVGRVQYFDHLNEGVTDLIGPQSTLPNAFTPFMLKNLSYEHEKEVRALIIARPDISEISEGGCDLPINLPNFVEEIVVSPFCQEWFYTTVLDVADRHVLKEKVKRSTLSPSVFYIQVTDNPS